MQAERSATGPRGPRVDAVALRRVVARLLAGGQVPWLHEEAARRMAERLPLIKLRPEALLDWSGPLGASAALLRTAYPQARHRAVVPAAGDPPAPSDLRRRWWDWRSGQLVIDTVPEAAVPAGQADLLWANMMLHGQDDAQAVFGRWHAATAVDGFLMFSTLGPGSLPELRDLYHRQGWGDAFAPFVDMHDLGDMLVHAGFADPVMDQELLTLTWPDATALLSEVRGWGGNVSPRRHAGLRTPRWHRRLLHALQQQAVAGRPGLTVELVYGHAFRVAPRPRVQPQTTLSLDDMRSMIRSSRS